MSQSSPPFTIGVYTPFIGGFYLGELICALLGSARRHDARLLVVRTGDFRGSDVLYANHQVDAWIVIVRSLTRAAIERLSMDGKPVCCIAMTPGIPGVQPVLSDNASGITAAMESLIQSGRRRFAFVGFLQEFDIAQRRNAYQHFIAARELEHHPEWITDTGSHEVRGGYDAADALLEHSSAIPDAFICGNDQNAIGVISRLAEAGLRVPEDVAVVGYDNSSLARTGKPPLASVSQNSDDLADAAVRYVMSTKEPPQRVPQPVVVPAQFIPRHSAGLEVSEGCDTDHEIPMSELLNALALSDEVVKFLHANPAERIHELLPRIDPEMRWCLVSRQDRGSNLLQPQHIFSPGGMVRTDRLSVDEANFPPLSAFAESNAGKDGMIAVMPAVNSGLVRCVIAVGLGPNISLSQHRPLVLAHLLELLALGLERSFIHAELETRVKLRTQELQNVNARLEDTLKSLQETQAELVRREKLASLGSLVAGVAHELNTPLGNSLMLSTTLEEDAHAFYQAFTHGEVKKRTLEEFVSRVSEAASRLTRNIGMAAGLVGDFKRLATQQHAETCQQFSLQELIGTTVHQLRQEHPGISLSIKAFDDVMIESYPFALAECLNELINNAAQHGLSDTKEGRVEVSVTRRDLGWVEISVTDNGVGIATESLKRVFDPFFTTRLGIQRGLGLNTVFNFVSGILKGQVAAENRQDAKGARFTLKIPLSVPGTLVE